MVRLRSLKKKKKKIILKKKTTTTGFTLLPKNAHSISNRADIELQNGSDWLPVNNDTFGRELSILYFKG